MEAIRVFHNLLKCHECSIISVKSPRINYDDSWLLPLNLQETNSLMDHKDHVNV